ncbi:hypothetical protein GQ37_000175 [Janthinobacterium sp. BJB1]|nr:hypothetical protein CSQ90_22175 [Janthinobacterium sp. BJB303]PJD00092.1 hypothetical protein GQ37_000175 [Janthinobacterium sp. BJB1]
MLPGDQEQREAAMKPAFITLREHYPSVAAVDQAALFGEIGWDDLIGKDSFANTCAIRVSLALIKAGIRLQGRMAIRRGPFKGALIEPGQARLAHMLASPSMFGAPEKFARDAANAGIGQRQGVVAFFRIPGYLGGAGGHIDILLPSIGVKVCGTECYWDCGEVWFWPVS